MKTLVVAAPGKAVYTDEYSRPEVFAGFTCTAGNEALRDHPVTRLQMLYITAAFHHLAHKLVAKAERTGRGRDRVFQLHAAEIYS